MAKIFISGSIPALPLVREVEAWLSAAQHEVVSWDSAAFFDGDYTLEFLQESAERFDAGLFMFSDSDRSLDERQVPLDGVVAPHEIVTAAVAQPGAFATQGLGDQEAFDVTVKEDGGVKLDVFGVDDLTAGPVGHGDAVTGGAGGI